MRSASDAKAMAKTLRQGLKLKKIDLGHVECLDMTAKMFGFRNWNTMEAVSANTSTPLHHTALQPLPKGWQVIGRPVSAFEAGFLPEGGPNGDSGALVVECRVGDDILWQRPDYAWIAVRQVFAAKRHVGRRIAFSADISCQNVADCAFPWLRIDNRLGQKLEYIGHFELPESQILVGTKGWQRTTLVLDVPESAATIDIGFTINGMKGHARIANMSFSETDLPLTQLRVIEAEEPQNLDLRVA